ncbi:MAG: penicillin-binding protein 1C [Candidatus Peribacteraceae bacterium]|nr:penicillin-binding protein 1C [Candidatus Peribacteraceae bacterium]
MFAPLPSSVLTGSSERPVRITDRNGRLLYEFRRGASGSQEWLSYGEIPPLALQAVIDTEDRTFFDHHGVSLRGTARALYQNVTSGRVVSGGSTITQQLIRIRRQSARSLFSKILETWYAVRLELRSSKEDILEAYLNSAYFGHQAYGLEAATKTYFGKSAHELSLAETSLLVGLLQSPNAFDPFKSMKAARERQKTVLASMRAKGDITAEQEEEASKAEIHLAPDRIEIEAPHFVFWILGRDDLPEDATVIRTTLDLDLQHEVERSIDNRLAKLYDKNVTSAAAVVLDAHTGDILAMVGSADYFDAEHDGAVNVAISPRQPGSTMKPFTYALAFTQGATAATTIADVESQFFTQQGNPYIPRNYDYGYHGLVRYREALANSYNIAAVKVLEKTGVGNLLAFLKDTGITSLTQNPEHYGLALTLGDAEISLMELSRSFAIFPRNGEILHERSLMTDPASPSHSILNPAVAWLVSDILSDDQARLPEFGDTGPLNFDFPVAAKTGTTRNSRDNWTIGYTPSRVVGVWVGNADNSPMKGTSGVTGAGPIFHDVMLAATRGLPVKQFVRPAGIVEKEICKLSGKLPTPDCPAVTREKFIAGTEPKDLDDIYRKITIDTRNGLRAGESCQKQYVRDEVFTVFPPELQRWARENGWKESPRDYSPLCGPSDHPAIRPSESWLTITKPNNHDQFELDPLVPDASEKIIFEASASPDIKEIEWFVNGAKVGSGKAPDFRLEWKPRVGEWNVEAKSGSSREQISISVTTR